ncbi:MAG: hypothetical protein JRJ41_12710 [Deltaproteobacteria bacterium]|nr:hypothetical protein [Deltaproteobacteria bacterium]
MKKGWQVKVTIFLKMQDQNLHVLIVSEHDIHLHVPNLSQADGYIVKSHTAADELRKKVSALLGRGLAVQKTKEIIEKYHQESLYGELAQIRY